METLKLLRYFIVVKNEGKLFQSFDAKIQNDFELEPFTFGRPYPPLSLNLVL